ncbi:Aminoacylase-1 [Pseudolycoriella hygida]|uniref:N-acyl-aliphatic-L-amino acid amidohydrolase n=1 Tax=Pseudolycoriella hygida TaxID=35572 RepID=A0A9Q0MIX3_9DIPT|nr:Aminoacylase-1 [Pseudolycoriella hygida]
MTSVIVGIILGVVLPGNEPEESVYKMEELPESSPWYGNEEIRIFRQYLTFPTMPPDINYSNCRLPPGAKVSQVNLFTEPTVKFLQQQASSLDLPVSIYYPVNQENPVVVMTWHGLDPSLSSVLLNSHMDVVPVFEEFWTHPPFAAEVDEEGRIFARGAQDTKSIGMLYLAGIRALKKRGAQRLKRTIHISFVPDEEMGGSYGLGSFVQSADFKALKIGYAMDEGMASETNEITVTNDERCTWRIQFTCHGDAGHGSILFDNTSGESFSKLVKKLMERRKTEAEKIKNLDLVSYANVTTINLTILKGGVQANVIPPELTATFDVRLAVNADHDEFQREINQWIEDAGGNITVNYLIKDPKANKTLADEKNPMWIALQNTAKEMDLVINPGVIPGATDMAYLRALDIPAFGFSPLVNTPVLMHDHDEFVKASTYLEGIDIYRSLIFNLGQM